MVKFSLTNRCQSVKIDGKSSRLPITCGVPQGSILGPLFFIIYVNGLLEMSLNTQLQIILYADDTVLYAGDKSADVAVVILEEGLCKLYYHHIKLSHPSNIYFLFFHFSLYVRPEDHVYS